MKCFRKKKKREISFQLVEEKKKKKEQSQCRYKLSEFIIKCYTFATLLTINTTRYKLIILEIKNYFYPLSREV